MHDILSAWEGTNVTSLSSERRRQRLRMVEALLFASTEPLAESAIAEKIPDEKDVHGLLTELQSAYAGRGVNLRRIDERWAFRTAEDLSFLLRSQAVEERRLSRAALETLAIIAYHQPVTRAEIEEIRGVSISKGTLDVLLEAGWIRLRGRRRTPGRPLTFGTTEAFLDHFGVESVADLPGLAELKSAGLLDTSAMGPLEAIAADDDPGLRADEDPLDPGDERWDEGDDAAH